MLRELYYPLDLTGDSQSLIITEWFRWRQIELLEAWFKKVAIDPAAILSVPQPQDNNVLTYCPRCHIQFMLPEGSCLNCRQKLLSLDETIRESVNPE